MTYKFQDITNHDLLSIFGYERCDELIGKLLFIAAKDSLSIYVLAEETLERYKNFCPKGYYHPPFGEDHYALIYFYYYVSPRMPGKRTKLEDLQRQPNWMHLGPWVDDICKIMNEKKAALATKVVKEKEMEKAALEEKKEKIQAVLDSY